MIDTKDVKHYEQCGYTVKDVKDVKHVKDVKDAKDVTTGVNL